MPNELLDLPIAGPERHVLQYERGTGELGAMKVLMEFYCRGELDIVGVVEMAYEIGRRSMVPVPLYMKLQEHLFGDKSEVKHG